jgi:hypothetical protein
VFDVAPGATGLLSDHCASVQIAMKTIEIHKDGLLGKSGSSPDLHFGALKPLAVAR